MAAFLLQLLRGHLIRELDSQQMAERWSTEGGYAQISCFFSENAGVSADQLKGFGYQLTNSLMEASITQESENPDARLFVTAYSGHGRITISSDKASVSLNALGVGGDFFLFHPQELLSGGYFAESDLNQDYILMDEETAWQLYGASDIVGKIVMVNGKPHMIAGVYKRPQGKLDKAAGLDQMLAYVSYSSLSGESPAGIDHFEVVMPNPIKGFAMEQVKNLLAPPEEESRIVENTNRFSLLSSLKILTEFGTRSMNGKAIIYPYWENLARGYDDIIALVSLFMVLFILFPTVVCLIWLICWWRHKSWTVRSVWRKLGDKIRIRKEKFYGKRKGLRREKR